MLHPTNTWPSTKAAMGTKFFAQAMRAFLDRDSFEGFRAYSLDTIGRLRETKALVEDVLAKRVREPALLPLLAELKWSLKNDDAAKEIAPAYCELLASMCTDKPQKTDVLHCCQILESKLQTEYRTKLIQRVIRSINDDKRIEILVSTGFLVSHLINEGHNRDYLMFQIDERFFSNPMKKVGAAVVRNFLRSVTDAKKKWIVIRQANPSLAALLATNNEWSILPIQDTVRHAQPQLLQWQTYREGSLFGVKTFLAADPFQASVHSEIELGKIKALRLLSADPMSISWSSNSYVYTTRSKDGHDLESSDAPLISGISRGKQNISGHRLTQARSLASRLYRNFDHSSKERLQRALATGAVAIDTGQDDVRLTSLWAAVEVLAGDPPEDRSRISHFVDVLSPCISIRYHRRLFVALHDTCIVRYRRKFKGIIDKVPTTIKSNDHTRFAKLIVDPTNQAILSELLELLSANPYLCHRVWRLNKLYGQPSECLSSILGHHDRVAWQLNRIYRVRNSLVHAGKSPTYTDTLVANTLEYLRASVMSLLRVSARQDSSGDLDQLFAEIGFEFKNMLAKLKVHGRKPFDEALAHEVFSAL